MKEKSFCKFFYSKPKYIYKPLTKPRGTYIIVVGSVLFQIRKTLRRYNMAALQMRPLSSLAKVFSHKIVGRATRNATCFGGQELSLQVAYRLTHVSYVKTDYVVSVSTELSAEPSLFKVESVPSYLAAYPHRYDKGYITRHSGPYCLKTMKSRELLIGNIAESARSMRTS